MKKIFLFLGLALALAGCKSEPGLGPQIEVVSDKFDLSKQTGASEWATQYIADFYDKYGTYIIYDWEEKDLLWSVSQANSERSGKWHITKPDPANVEGYLRMLDEYWFNNPEFTGGGTTRALQSDSIQMAIKEYLPTRMILVDSMWRENMNTDFLNSNSVPTMMVGTGGALIFPGVDSLAKMTPDQKEAFGKRIYYRFRKPYIDEGWLDVPPFYPKGFFDISGDLGYYEMPLYVDGDGNSAAISAANNRTYREQLYEKGFLPNYAVSFTGDPMQQSPSLMWWVTGATVFPTLTISVYQQTGLTMPDGEFIPNGTVVSTGSFAAALTGMGNDVTSYMKWMVGEHPLGPAYGVTAPATWAQIKPFLKDYPVILEKWNWLVDYYRNVQNRPEVRETDPVTYPITLDQLQ